jgi:ribulose-5-phosphate 4-epimerase/fuculose-1-phosphate aldolase
MTSDMAPVEQAARVDLAAAYRLVAHHGWDDLISTHISAKVPGKEDRFLINRRGELFGEIKASSLVELALDGTVISPPGAPVNAAGFTIHSAVHASNPEVGCVIHLHAPYGTAVSMMRCGLLPLSQKALALQGRLAYHDYEGIALDLDERARLIADLGDRRAMILRNHGTLAIGRTVAEAFALIYTLETACKVQVLAQSCGQELVTPSEQAQRNVTRQTAELADFMGAFGETAWPGLLRLLDAGDPDYRT